MEVIKGINSVNELLKNSPGKIHKIIIKNERKLNPRIFDIIKRAKKFGINVQRVKPAFFSKYKNSQGVIAEVNIITFGKEEELKERLSKENLILAFDGIQDPRNLGAIIRSSHFFGISTIVLPSKRITVISEAVSKTSAGAIAYIQPFRVKSIPYFLKNAKEHGFKIVCAESRGAIPLEKMEKRGKFILLFGSEDKGISSEPKKQCDYSVKIESPTNFESLNLSVSVSIFLYAFKNAGNL